MITEEMLAAYADGELDPDARARVAAAAATDPDLARRLDAHAALKSRLGAALDLMLDEPVPARLLAAVKAPVTATVIDLAARRSASRRSVGVGVRRWALGGALAASLAVGVLVGQTIRPEAAPGVQVAAGGLLATGPLSRALTSGLASAPDGGPVKIGLSYRDRDRRYCRTFSTSAQAGLACRKGDGWDVRILAPAASPDAPVGRLRTASSSTPLTVLSEVDATIDGQPLDADAERRARDAGWR